MFVHVQSSRFDSKESHTPGPGAYNLQKRSDWLREKYGQRELPPDMLVGEGIKDGSVGLCSFVFNLKFHVCFFKLCGPMCFIL